MSYTPAKHFESDPYNSHSNYHGNKLKSSRTPHGSCILKVVKLVINIVVLVLYRVGAQGKFLGVGGTWNLNEEKNPDSEIVASGIFVGYFIYTSLAVISFCLELRRKGDDDDSFDDDDDDLPNDNSIVVDLLMNFVGTFMWVAVGGTCLHYWTDYQDENMYIETAQEKKFGIAVGSLCIVQGAVFLVDTIVAFRIHWEQNQ